MKRTLLITLIAVSAATAIAFQTLKPAGKLKVEYSAEEWQTKLNILEYTKEVLKSSSVASNVALPLCDTLSSIQRQWLQQLQPQIKTDSAKKK
ncbi:MAG TPA: hypothetical protein VK644_15045 [Chitinophagaceae bacterium]|nr:hypothetical protein [Chitinophagaceae bacterium]